MSLDRTDRVPTSPDSGREVAQSPEPGRRRPGDRRLVRRLRREVVGFQRLSATLALALILVLFAAVTGDVRQDDGPVDLGAGVAGVKPPRENPEATERPVAAPEKAPPLPVFGRSAARLLGRGEASYYHHSLEGRPTASGTPYRSARLTAAHRTLPLGSKLRVTNVRNGRSVVVEVNDRGPFHGRRVIDLSQAAARELGMLHAGRAQVELELIDS
ncbi:MAG TPA: septal ring lytic transglycosylase RlpA family protein [Thermoanaerobaculia bacterium]|nr:septal ring lytic transglycosylase RlpA family protein [Thermoanaerobaculia bacterium]